MGRNGAELQAEGSVLTGFTGANSGSVTGQKNPMKGERLMSESNSYAEVVTVWEEILAAVPYGSNPLL